MSVERVDPKYSSHEFLALSNLCNEWALPSKRDRSLSHNWEVKLRAFRRAVIAGYRSRESLPHELVYSEWLVEIAAIDFVKKSADRPTEEHDCQKWLREVKVPMYPKQIEPSRQLPWTDQMCRIVAESVDDKRSTTGSIAKRLLAKRLLPIQVTVNPSKRDRYKTIAGHIARAKKDKASGKARLELRDEQMIAASVYLDLAIKYGKCERKQCQARLLDALVASAYPQIAIFYLIQCAQCVPPDLSIPTVGPDDVVILCQKLGSEGGGSFESLTGQ